MISSRTFNWLIFFNVSQDSAAFGGRALEIISKFRKRGANFTEIVLLPPSRRRSSENPARCIRRRCGGLVAVLVSGTGFWTAAAAAVGRGPD